MTLTTRLDESSVSAAVVALTEALGDDNEYEVARVVARMRDQFDR